MRSTDHKNLPNQILDFARTVPVTVVSNSTGSSRYIPTQHRIIVDTTDLLRQDVSILMHEIAHAWHYAKIKKIAGSLMPWDTWSAVTPEDRELHTLFLARREGYWKSRAGKTYDQLAVESGHGYRIEKWKLDQICQCSDVRHYAMCTPDEFFAVLSDMYWLHSDWPPFTKENFRLFDPEAHDLIEFLWDIKHDVSSV